jgi:hypothetical protein
MMTCREGDDQGRAPQIPTISIMSLISVRARMVTRFLIGSVVPSKFIVETG